MPLPTFDAEASMLLMPAIEELWTTDMLRALPEDGLRHELLDGVHIVTPTPRWDHQRAVLQLCDQLRPHVARELLGEIVPLPGDVAEEPFTLVNPDLFLVPGPRRPAHSPWPALHELGLTVEILSPGTARRDRREKRQIYQRNAIPEYWIVDLDTRLVERWRPGEERPEILTELLVWHPEGAAEPPRLDLPALFRAILGD